MKMRNVLIWLLTWIPLAAQPSGPILSYTATTANVTGAPDSIRIDLFRWSTEAERNQVVSAWENKATSRGGRGGAPGRGARTGAARGTAAEDGSAAGPGGETAGAPAPPAATPEESLAAALQRTGTVGYLWSSEAAGYALRYAGKLAAADGGERIILMTDRRLGKRSGLWAPLAGTPSSADFSVIELRVNAKGEGEGRISLMGKLALESTAKVPVPESYDALPVVLKNLKLRTAVGK